LILPAQFAIVEVYELLLNLDEPRIRREDSMLRDNSA
jgi:hypothetical protein